MQNISIPVDAFSHGQIKSKLWLCQQLNFWSAKHFDTDCSYVLSWYGSWVGLGPFLLLSQTKIRFQEVNLVDINLAALDISEKLLEFWRLESVKISVHQVDANEIQPDPYAHHIVVNTACEHIRETAWLENLPTGAMVLLQSTNMRHIEHINPAASLSDFKSQYEKFVTVLESDQMEVSYPTSKFSRFMLLGKRK